MKFQEFLPLLKRAKAEKDDLSLSWENAAIVNLSTNLSAVEDQNYADHYNYDPTRQVNLLLTNGLSNLYHLDESTSILRDIWSSFSFLFHFSTKI